VIIADINGVRLINDAFGYSEGDTIIRETAKIIHDCCRDGDILARTGGDEFSILMPRTGSDDAYAVLQAIQAACLRHNSTAQSHLFDISLSIGFGTKAVFGESMAQTIKMAEEYMCNRKLLSRKSSHNALLASIMTTMFERSQETEEHAERIAVLAKRIGIRLDLSQKQLDELELLSMLHDIGKIAIDDRILNKPGKLDDAEWTVMKKHPEIGYRIAMTSPDLESIADFILSHHERWDGKGYPQGLQGTQIPLLSRILAVADAFDAMTQNRVYRAALSRKQALAEIMLNAGTQFDPDIARIFVDSQMQADSDAEAVCPVPQPMHKP
jgi:diguanylate cyclase (GGDEF)-like protein